MTPTGTEGIVYGILNWIVVSILRKFWPGLWEALNKRILRIVLIATTAALLACVHGIITGLPAMAAMKLAAQAFAVSVTAREITKGDKVEMGGYLPTLSRPLSIKTDVPEPDK